MTRVIVDYHLHTNKSPDGKGSMNEYVTRAKQMGINEIGFSDHIDNKNLAMKSSLINLILSDRFEDFQKIKPESEISIKLGVEIDFIPNKVEKIRKILNTYPFDYVIGSIHMIGRWGIDDPKQIKKHSQRDALEAYEQYFEMVRKMCSARLFDIVGHIDLIKIFGLRPNENISQIYEETAKDLAKSGLCVEINAKGLVRPCREIYPSLQFMRILHAHSVPITFGSDAHQPVDLGRNLDVAVRMGKEAGYVEACAFARRKRTFFKI
jgi:histidinol-phosphatase (PHP family)